MQVELEALRARAVQEQQQRRAKQQVEKAAAAEAAAARAANSAGASTADADDETTQLLLRTVKVTWDPSIGETTGGSFAADHANSRLPSQVSWSVVDALRCLSLHIMIQS